MIPQGPAYISGMLKSLGHDVVGVNSGLIINELSAQENLALAVREGISSVSPDIIAVGGMVAEYLFIKDAISASRHFAPHTPIILGGSILTNDRPLFEVLRPDFGVIDEGEVPIKELLNAIEHGNPVENIENIAYWKNGVAICNTLRNANYELDDLPLPDYDVLDIESYFQLSNQIDNYFHVRTQKYPRIIPLSSGRSCPFKCTFCQYSTLDGSRRKYRGRTMQSVVREIVHFKNKYDFNILKIYDDLFSVKSDRIFEFCELLKKENVQIDWNASMRVGDVTPELLSSMKDAGCIHIGYGFESADDGVLKSMNKKITQSQIQNAIEMTELAGIGVQANFIYGDPAETEETVAKTIGFYKKNCLDHIVHNDYIMPYPGSPIFDVAKKKYLISSNQQNCETLHLRPRYNITEMDEQSYHKTIDPIIEDKLGGLKFAKKVEFGIDFHEKFNAPYFKNKIPLAVKCSCPHCSKSQNSTFPVDQAGFVNFSDRIKYLKAIKYYCSTCHKRFLISLLQLAGLEASLSKFVLELQHLASKKEPVVVANIREPEFLDNLAGFGVKITDLNIKYFLTSAGEPSLPHFFQYPVLARANDNVQRGKHLRHVILPDARSMTIHNNLEALGVDQKNITIMEQSFTELPSKFDQTLRDWIELRGKHSLYEGVVEEKTNYLILKRKDHYIGVKKDAISSKQDGKLEINTANSVVGASVTEVQNQMTYSASVN